MLDNILVTGITPLENYPRCGHTRYYKQCMESSIVDIHEQKPGIESINEIKVSIEVKNFKTIDTILGAKLIIEGKKHVKIIYTAHNTMQSVHSAQWSEHFCEFVLLRNMSYEECLEYVSNIFVGLEDVHIKCIHRYWVEFCIVYILCPQFRPNYKEACPSNEEDKTWYEY